MKTDWSNYTIAYDGINYSVNYRDNGDLVACENYVANSPTPKNPQPLISNLPAGTYKVADYKGDWWEFTLTEDLHGIGDVRDSVEWDKYGHKGFESRKIGQILSYTDEIIETAYMSTTGGLDTGAYICYVLATPTRTALTFTKNNASTAPECPMEFLTDTPSLEYPAEVFDASGTVKARGKNLFDKSAVTLFYYVDHFTGIIEQSVFGYCVSEYIEVMPGQSYIASGINTASSKFKSYAFYNTEKVFISGGSSISIAAVAPTNAKYIVFTTRINDLETTMLERGDAATAYEPYRPEVTATIPPLRSNAAGTVCDEFEVKTGKLTRKIGRIESYNGEDVGDDWISSTGALDTGATVEYVLAEPIEEQYTPVILPTYYPTTVITTTNDTHAELTTTATVKVEDEE